MGCAGSIKVHVTSVECSSTQLDDLPVEILHRIFDELDIRQIYRSIYSTSKYFRDVVSNYNRFHFNLKMMSYQSFNYLISQIRPEQVTQMTLTNDENTPLLIELFLKKFSLNSFVRLRSLTLIDIDDDEMINQILIPIAESDSRLNLSSIEIINQNESYDEVFLESIKMILSKETLEKFHADLSYGRGTSNALSWPEQCAIRHLNFRETCSVSFLRTIFSSTRNLEKLLVNDVDFDDEVDLNQEVLPVESDDDEDNDHESDTTTTNDDSEVENENDENPAENLANQPEEIPPAPLLPPPSPPLLPNPLAVNILGPPHPTPRRERFESIQFTENLHSLTIETSTITMSKIEWLLKEFLNLKHFRLFTTTNNDDETLLDGSLWSKVVHRCEQFEFIFSLSIDDESSFDANECIEKFRTSFWVEEKHWTVALETYPSEVFLYTLPFPNSTYLIKTRPSLFEFHTNLPDQIQMEKSSMDKVQDLYVDVSGLSDTSNKNSNFPHFGHVRQLLLYGQSIRSRSFFDHLKTFVDLTTIEELCREDSLPTSELDRLLRNLPNLQSIRTTPTLLDHLNAAKFTFSGCLRSLTVYPYPADEDRHTYVHIEPFCSMFPRIQYLSIPINVPESGRYVLEQLKNDLIKVTFRYAPTENSYDDSDTTDDPSPDTFVSWYEELSNEYHCTKKSSQIHIWLK